MKSKIDSAETPDRRVGYEPELGSCKHRWKQLEGAPITELTMGRRQGTAKEGAHWEKFRF